MAAYEPQKLQDFSFGKAMLLVAVSILLASASVLAVRKIFPGIGV